MHNFPSFLIATILISTDIQANSVKDMAIDRAQKIKAAIEEMKTKCPDLISEANGCRKREDYKTCLSDLKKRCSKEEQESKRGLEDKAGDVKDKVSDFLKH